MTKKWDQHGEALDYVISKNLVRRHLTESQRAVVASKIATMKHGGDRKGDDFKPSIEGLNVSQKEAAESQTAKFESGAVSPCPAPLDMANCKISLYGLPCAFWIAFGMPAGID